MIWTQYGILMNGLRSGLAMNEKELIETLYWKKNYSIKQIEQETSIKNVSKKMDKYGIRKRTPKENFRVHIMGAVRKHRSKDVSYYSALEKKLKKILEDIGLTEGIDWQFRSRKEIKENP